MQINWRMQSKHMSEMHDWIEIQKVERDICFLYHQIEPYQSIMGDLNYEELYPRPYWFYLDLDSEKDRDHFVRDGCLVMILAMAWEAIDGSGGYVFPHIQACRNAIENLTLEDERITKIVETVNLALDYAESSTPEDEQIQDLSSWVYDEVVGNYFRSRTSQPKRPEM